MTQAADGSGNVVLAAQSLGGFTAPLAVAKTGARALVFVNAMIPLPGETPGEWWDATGWEAAHLAAAERGGFPADVDLETYFLHDVPPEVAAAGEQHQRPEADAAFASVCDFGAWPRCRSRSPLARTTGSSQRASSGRSRASDWGSRQTCCRAAT